MTPKLNRVYLGDNRDTIDGFPDNWVDTFISDWPYYLGSKEVPIKEIYEAFMNNSTYYGTKGFMGNAWDSFIPGTDFTKLHYKKHKPGGYYLAFCSPRTADIAMMSLRMAGYIITDVIVWLYGSDFNKSSGRTRELCEYIIVARKPISGTEYLNQEVKTHYLYQSKASTKERHAGCVKRLWLKDDNALVGYRLVDAEIWLKLKPDERRQGNIHPTVKPVELMRFLCSLTGDGLVVDPFSGSGTLGIGALYAGRPFILCELNPEYVMIAEDRLAHAIRQLRRGKRVNEVEAMEPPVKDGYKNCQIKLF